MNEKEEERRETERKCEEVSINECTQKRQLLYTTTPMAECLAICMNLILSYPVPL